MKDITGFYQFIQDQETRFNKTCSLSIKSDVLAQLTGSLCSLIYLSGLESEDYLYLENVLDKLTNSFTEVQS